MAGWMTRTLFVIAVVGIGAIILDWFRPVGDAEATTTATSFLLVATDIPQTKPTKPIIFPNDKPDAFLVLSGQMYGYIQPCGCSRPQVGGLERRYELIRELCARGVPVSAADLGDLAPSKADEQSRSKYEFSVRMLAKMPYGAMGIGVTELKMSLEETLGRAQNYQPPYVVAANLEDKEGRFPEMFRGWVVHEAQFLEGKKPEGKPCRIGYIGLMGTQVSEEAKKIDATLTFTTPVVALRGALDEVRKQNVEVVVLLFQGAPEEAATLANQFPELHLIVSRSDADIAPSLPKMIGPAQKTMLLHLGHKGRSVGIVAVSRSLTGNGVDLKYQLVDLVEPYELPDDQTNPNRDLMREYVKAVFQNKYITKVPLTDHPLRSQPGMGEAKFVGAAACQGCHPKAYDVWSKSKHSQAYEGLEKYGRPIAEMKRPDGTLRKIGRQFDPDSASCHVTGFGYHGGWVDVARTPNLKGNQCENCHGPASLHVASPTLPQYWEPLRLKINDPKTEMKCRKCHDADNDPHFDLEKYWPKIKHSK